MIASIKGQLSDSEGSLFLYIDSHLRNEHELKVGDRIECVLTGMRRKPEIRYCSCEGELVGDCATQQKKVRPLPSRKAWWEIIGYWNELHVPSEIARQYDLAVGDVVECEWHAISRSGESNA